MALALILAVCLAQTAAAEMQVYAGGISEEGIRQLTATLSAAFPQETWICVGGGESLRELVLSDRAPQLAVCAPQEARAWAAQGLLAAMDGVSGEIGRMQRQVVEACVYDESLFMLPLSARHRQMAVNVHLMEARSMGYLLDSLSCPV